MLILIKKVFFVITLNSALLLMIIIGIQNSSHRKKINLFLGETVYLPVGFIIGISFISGSLIGSLVTTDFSIKK
mgnify:CR=1 FL=1